MQEYVTSLQERQLLALAPLMLDEPIIPMTVVDGKEPLEKTRLYGPFTIEVVAWIHRMGNLVTMGWDVDGKEYIEY